MLVGAFILATLAIIALPSMDGLLERQRTRAATYALLNNLALARLTAVNRRSIAALCPSTDGATCARSSDWSDGWLLFLDRDGNRRPDTAGDIVRQDIPPASRHIRGVASAWVLICLSASTEYVSGSTSLTDCSHPGMSSRGVNTPAMNSCGTSTIGAN